MKDIAKFNHIDRNMEIFKSYSDLLDSGDFIRKSITPAGL